MITCFLVLDNVVDNLKMMASVSGRTVINIFDSDPLLRRQSPQELIAYVHSCPTPIPEEYSSDVGVPEGHVRILKRPAEYTYKNTHTKAFRPDDPIAHQKSRAEQLHNIEINLRRRNAQLDTSAPRFVNFEY